MLKKNTTRFKMSKGLGRWVALILYGVHWKIVFHKQIIKWNVYLIRMNNSGISIELFDILLFNDRVIE